MTDQQYQKLLKNLDTIIGNQDIINTNLSRVAANVERLQEEMNTVLRNQRIIGTDQEKLIKEVSRISGLLSR